MGDVGGLTTSIGSGIVKTMTNQNDNFGSRLVASKATAVEINEQGQVRFTHPNLHNGTEWIDSGYRVTKGDLLDLYYDWTPSRGYYVARVPSDLESQHNERWFRENWSKPE